MAPTASTHEYSWVWEHALDRHTERQFSRSQVMRILLQDFSSAKREGAERVPDEEGVWVNGLTIVPLPPTEAAWNGRFFLIKVAKYRM